MSQIETLMLVTLGFVVAALVALFLGRLIWSYAVLLGKRRTERAAPVTIAALQAERDQLRAEYAMLSRKLELRLEDLKTRLAEQTAEVSRNRNRIEHSIKDSEKLNKIIVERDSQIDQLNKHIEPLEGELATRTQAIQQYKEQLRDREDEVAALGSERDNLLLQLSERDRQISGLRNELVVQPISQGISSEAQSAHDRLQLQIEELTGLSQQIEQQRSEMSREVEEFSQLRGETADSPDTASPPNSPAQQRKTAKKTKRSAAKAKTPGNVAKKPAQPDAPAGSASEADAPEQQANGEIVDAKVKELHRQGQNLEQQILDAERETDQLQGELKKLDDVWAEKIAALHDAAGSTASQRSEPETAASGDAGPDAEEAPNSDEKPPGRSRQNVISLAAKIRALQRKSAEN